MQGDTGWQIYNRLTTQEAREYLLMRRAQGFNTILTQVTTSPADLNRLGDKPFEGNADFAKPNERYHTHVSEIISLADSLGMLVVMSQPWQDCCLNGYGQTSEKPLQKNGPKKSYELGKYYGRKFGRHKNLFWIMGGDNDPLNDRLSIEAMARSIFDTAPQQLITYHAKPTHSSTDLYR